MTISMQPLNVELLRFLGKVNFKFKDLLSQNPLTCSYLFNCFMVLIHGYYKTF